MKAFYYIYKNAGSGLHSDPRVTFPDYGEALLINFLMTLGDFKV